MQLRPRTGARWRSGRTIVLTVMLVLTVPACLFAGWWQWQRAQSGNALSYGYMVEWPIFAVLAVAGWWQLVRPAARTSSGRRPRPRPAHPDTPARPAVRWDPDDETPELQAYNAALAEMAATGRGLSRRRLGRQWRGARRG